MNALRALVGRIVLTLLGQADLAIKQCGCGCGDVYRRRA